MTDMEKAQLRYQLGQVFNPSTPIEKKDLFAGRQKQINTFIDVVSQKGQHAIIFGERGVGKTSIANVLPDFLRAVSTETFVPIVNCNSTDDYSKIWHKVFSRVNVIKQGAGFKPIDHINNFGEEIPSKITLEYIGRTLQELSQGKLVIITFDEFDQVNQKTRSLFANTIKMLSDYRVAVTLVLVGIGESVSDLIAEHKSIERSLIQILMPRMSQDELMLIIRNGLTKVGMQMDDDVRKEICIFSQGLPHYTHLLTLNAGREAVQNDSMKIEMQHLENAIKVAIEGVKETITEAYHKAVMSSRKKSIYPQVLLSCALAQANERGYFAAADVRDPLTQIMEKKYDIPSFIRHLYAFCENSRGPVLKRTGTKHSFKFRFTEPIMQPFIIMKGVSTKLIDRQKINEIRKGRQQAEIL